MTGIKAVVLDWAGTIVDFGSCGPMGVFVKAFASFGIDISIADARGPMGRAKRDHISELLRQPRIAAAWEARHGARPGESEIDLVYDVFLPMNVAVAGDFADLIPGALEVVQALRARGLKIGSTTGYTREIMARVQPVAAAAGYSPDNLVCAGDLAEGRPSPLMMYRTFADLGVHPPWSVVKVDDTPPGIGEGVAAGTWTVGLSVTGNEVGLSHAEWLALDEQAQRQARAKAEAALLNAGADYVVDGVADLLPVIEAIEARLARGERPAQRG
jgi:phosphonoacetaldehyde hydrolase